MVLLSLLFCVSGFPLCGAGVVNGESTLLCMLGLGAGLIMAWGRGGALHRMASFLASGFWLLASGFNCKRKRLGKCLADFSLG